MTVAPVRIQRSRQHKQVSPNGLPVVYVGRPSKWGNPFEIGQEEFKPNIKGIKIITPKTINECVELYAEFLKMNRLWTEKNIEELRGKNLSCWCKIGEPCHADYLLKIANI